MAIYEFYCGDCQHRFETMRPMAAANDAAACPLCASTRTRRVISLFNAFSGQGDSRRVLAEASCGGCTPTVAGCAACHRT
ncbi:MAG: zinc ribbon domain-containing protein [Anaerolineae bacterium]|nr:zinc ribbon domain-containing protein [Anaerolineae bacterium]